MTKVRDIDDEVKSSNNEELIEFRNWFLEFDSHAWDAQIERDAHTGKLDRLAQKALEEHERGESKAL